MESEHQLTNRFLEGLRKDIRTLCRSSMHTSRASLFPRGSCFGCGSTEHRVSSCPKRDSAPRVCYYCKEPGHIKPMCPKLRSMSVASVQPVAAQPVSQIAAVQPLGQIAPAPRGYSSVETGGTSQTGQITGKSSTQTL
ncbi:unnamed protein product [Microthlaspi erraticum]|uniref:CCHC-type domain-containing protein n=1 Tax=Microthlaspi erraticum TaxID=1685480 RepID=A0A6D2ITF1_9BRAS|nr:unnamed protein product [Microthlaspi erraticum]